MLTCTFTEVDAVVAECGETHERASAVHDETGKTS